MASFKKIITDNDTPFLGWQTSKFMKKYNIQKVKSSPYNPQSNGQVESFNKMLKQLLRKIVLHNQKIGIIDYLKLFDLIKDLSD